MQGGYAPEKAGTLKDDWAAASARQTQAAEDARANANKPQYTYAHDNVSNTDVLVTKELAASQPDRYSKPQSAGGGGGRGGSLTPTAIQRHVRRP